MSDVDQSKLGSSIRPLFPVHLTAGLDEVRMPDPNQASERQRLLR
ncbi:hypothetical protein [Roseovarius indicus]|nr:hypothetical protein [Roseovarius indicus]